MFNKLKLNLLREVIYELESLCTDYDLAAESKKCCGQDNNFEVGIGIGIRKAIEQINKMCDRYM